METVDSWYIFVYSLFAHNCLIVHDHLVVIPSFSCLINFAMPMQKRVQFYLWQFTNDTSYTLTSNSKWSEGRQTVDKTNGNHNPSLQHTNHAKSRSSFVLLFCCKRAAAALFQYQLPRPVEKRHIINFSDNSCQRCPARNTGLDHASYGSSIGIGWYLPLVSLKGPAKSWQKSCIRCRGKKRSLCPRCSLETYCFIYRIPYLDSRSRAQPRQNVYRRPRKETHAKRACVLLLLLLLQEAIPSYEVMDKNHISWDTLRQRKWTARELKSSNNVSCFGHDGETGLKLQSLPPRGHNLGDIWTFFSVALVFSPCCCVRPQFFNYYFIPSQPSSRAFL